MEMIEIPIDAQNFSFSAPTVMQKAYLRVNHGHRANKYEYANMGFFVDISMLDTLNKAIGKGNVKLVIGDADTTDKEKMV